jgi:dipeptidyl aminopeptidase/acylaminoacyl peptidase
VRQVLGRGRRPLTSLRIRALLSLPWRSGILLAAIPLAAGAAPELTIPEYEPAAEKRLMTVDDVMGLRKVAALKVSPDGRRYAVFVRQADVAANTYRSAWFVGGVGGANDADAGLTHVGDGGEMRFLILPNGLTAGDLAYPEVQWSPDSEWIVYTAKHDDEVQLWRSKADGSAAEQLTHNPSNVLSFAWSDDGNVLFFTAGATREELTARAERRARSGYNYNEDLYSIFDLMSPHLSEPVDPDPRVWVYGLESGEERPASAAEQDEYQAARQRDTAGREGIAAAWLDAAIPPVANERGELVGMKRAAPQSYDLQVVYSTGAGDENPQACPDERCFGLLQKVWWSRDGAEAMILRMEGGGRLPGHALYAWNPGTGEVRTVGSYPDDSFWQFDQSHGSLIIARQSHTVPPQIAAIDERSGALTTLVDLNPEIRDVRIGRAERFDWALPELSGELAGAFPERAGGYILYPPDFDPGKKYPVFIEPYAFVGFSGSVGQENPLQVYAAAGMVVLSFGYPHPAEGYSRFGRDATKKLYSKELGFPYMTVLMESTTRGLDTAAARGFIDLTRVGIGSISMGTLVPLYLVQNHDRITAMTIAAGSWSANEYYWPTRKGREAATMVQSEWRPKPVGEGAEYWRSLDIADHIDQIETPILMHHSLSEAHIALRFMRHLDDEGKPYDAYVFTNELHSKWQPAHLHAIQQRNVDWFRFWLQDYADPAPDKQEQYRRWRELRVLQCKNPRSLRDYCSEPD